MSKAKRKSPVDLLAGASQRYKPIRWFDKLSLDDQMYIREVVAAFNASQDPPCLTKLADAVRVELGVSVSAQSIIRTIRELSCVS